MGKKKCHATTDLIRLKDDFLVKRIYITKDVSGREPEWYWGNGYGFHDAKILSVERIEYNYDFKEKNPTRNCLAIRLDLVYEETVSFYNYKILKECDLIGNWWLCDTLSFEKNKYILTVTLEDKADSRKEHTFMVSFDRAAHK